MPVCWLRRISLQMALANQRQLWPVAIAMMWPLSSRASSTVATTWWSNSGGSRPSRRSMVSRSSLSLAASCSVSVGTLMFVSRIADQARMACAAQDRAWARSPSRSGPHLALALVLRKSCTSTSPLGAGEQPWRLVASHICLGLPGQHASAAGSTLYCHRRFILSLSSGHPDADTAPTGRCGGSGS